MERISCDVLVLCEESQAISSAFRERGFIAYSCDILPCSGNYPEWHLQCDAFQALTFVNARLIIMHPPCTYLCVAGNRWFVNNPERVMKRNFAIKFACNLFRSACQVAPFVALENPVGVLSNYLGKPQQYIEPYYFGDPVRKKTGLWLSPCIPLLVPDNIVIPDVVTLPSGKTMSAWHYYSFGYKNRSSFRSKTFPGIARAIAEQWSCLLEV